MKVLVYGSINIDLVYHVDNIVAPGETGTATALVQSAGGKGANQAAALAKAGLDVYLAGKVGGDGGFPLELLKSYGVNTDHVSTGGSRTGQAIIQLDKTGQNAIFCLRGGNNEITPDEIGRTLDAFGSNDMVVLQNEITNVDEIILGAEKKGPRICLNPSPYTRTIEKLPLDKVNVFFINELEGAAMAGISSPESYWTILDAIVGRFPDAEIVLTAGKKGAFYAYKNDRESAPIVEVPVVDTVGAGDTFSGYFIAARARNFPAKRSLELASKAASVAVSRPGAMASVPLADEVFP
jgi:ribokinase